MPDSGLPGISKRQVAEIEQPAADFVLEVKDMKSKRFLHCAIAALSLGLLSVAGNLTTPAGARSLFFDDDDNDGYSRRSSRPERHYEGSYDSRLSGKTPLLAVVALREQRISVYDASGKLMELPVSSGQTGLETPSGIFSVVQKDEDHHSSLFDDASMPFMERITWTGISLHAGVLPGYAASHGCVRMPEDFAFQLFQISNLGLRVILVRDDIAPAEVAQPAMFTAASGQGGGNPSSRVRTLASQKSMEADAATRRFKDAKLAASKKAAEAVAAEKALHAAEAGLAAARSEFDAAGHAVETATPERTEQAQSAKAQAATKVEAAQAKLEAAKADAQSKSEASAKAEQELQAAAVETAKAHDAAEEVALDIYPTSVFISRKTQRLYVRKNNMPVFEAPVTMRDADKPIGTFVFTALDYGGASGAMRWNLVSMYKNAATAEPAAPAEPAAKGKAKVSRAEAAPADVAGAQAALDRITVTPEAQERISAALLPGSSLIISDEGLHSETGKDTDFIVVMSGEPQGGLSSRHKPTHKDDIWADGFFGGSSRSGRRGGGGGWFFSE